MVAKTAFNHSINYRSVVLYGKPTVIEDQELKAEQYKLDGKIKPGSGKFILFERHKKTTAFKVSRGSFNVFGFEDLVDALVIAPELASP